MLRDPSGEAFRENALKTLSALLSRAEDRCRDDTLGNDRVKACEAKRRNG